MLICLLLPLEGDKNILEHIFCKNYSVKFIFARGLSPRSVLCFVVLGKGLKKYFRLCSGQVHEGSPSISKGRSRKGWGSIIPFDMSAWFLVGATLWHSSVTRGECHLHVPSFSPANKFTPPSHNLICPLWQHSVLNMHPEMSWTSKGKREDTSLQQEYELFRRIIVPHCLHSKDNRREQCRPLGP